MELKRLRLGQFPPSGFLFLALVWHSLYFQPAFVDGESQLKPPCRPWTILAYRVRVPRAALVFVCGSWVRTCFVFRRSSLNHRSWISEPVLSSWSNSPGCFEKSISVATQSGRRPSVSVNRYSRPSSQELTSCPERSKIAGSPANATTARPTNNGGSDSRKFRSFSPPSRQVFW